MNTKLKEKINSKYHITVKTLNIHNKKNNNVSCKRKNTSHIKRKIHQSISWFLDQNFKSSKKLGLSSTSSRRPQMLIKTLKAQRNWGNDYKFYVTTDVNPDYCTQLNYLP